MLRRALRIRPGGPKFRRQHPVGRYVVDFACLSARLAIEVDGAVHDGREHADADRQRDREIEAAGLRVIRFAARDVLNDCDAVIRAVVVAARPLHRPADGPPPRSGEVLRRMS